MEEEEGGEEEGEGEEEAPPARVRSRPGRRRQIAGLMTEVKLLDR